MKISVNQISFPESWNNPALPAYGTFPWPFGNKGGDADGTALDERQGIDAALSKGFRHIDTAFAYGNQNMVGEAVRNAEISRKDVYVTSKLHICNNNYKDAKLKIKEAVQVIWGDDSESDYNYLDCFMIHYPGAGRPLDAWRALVEARDAGMVKHIGVSNFEIRHLEKIKKTFGEFPEVNQIEFHPWIYSRQAGLVRFCKENSIALEGYSPLAQGKDLKNPVIAEMAGLYKTTPARIVLKWCMQHGVKPVVGSRNPENMEMNARAYDYTISDGHMRAINDLSSNSIISVAEQWKWFPQKAGLGGSVRGGNPLKNGLKRLLGYMKK